MSKQTDVSTDVPTDSFGDKMRFADAYGDYLPKSENIPKTRPRNGVTGITHDGEIYCIDCAKKLDLVTENGGKLQAKVDGKTMSFKKAPWTGIVLTRYETDTIMHCGCHKKCENTVEGENHPYNHDSKIGIGINEKAIMH